MEQTSFGRKALETLIVRGPRVWTVAGLLAGLLVLNPARAATITWGAPTAIAGDADVATNGTAVYAYTESGAGATVNGVSFAAGNSPDSLGGGNVTLSGFSGGVDPAAFIGSNPVGLSPAYQTVVKGGAWNSGSTATVTLNNLVSGHVYLVQFWVCDYRTFGGNRSETLSAGNTSGSLTYLQNKVGPACGTWVTGTFTANATSQVITLSPNASAQMNAIQVRDVTPPPAYFSGAAGTVWDANTTANWSTNSGGPYNQTWTAASGIAAAFEGVATNVTVSGAVNVQSIRFNTDGYLLGGSGTLTLGGYGTVMTGPGSNTIGAVVAGTVGLSKQGSGMLTLTGTNTYSGTTTIDGGTLAVSGAGKWNSSPYSGAIVNNGTFSYHSTALQTLSGVISGAGALTQSAGTLTLQGANTFTGDVTVSGGKLRANKDTATLNATSGALGNGQVAHTITINNGGTVELATANVFGDQKGSPQVGWVINAGGLLTQATNANRQNVLGSSLTLNGGSIAVGSGSSAQYCALALSGMSPTVTVGGSQPSYITNAPGASNAGLALGTWNGVCTFNVADATGNSDADLIVGTTLQNAISTDGNSGTQGVSCLVKAGAGTMRITGALLLTGVMTVEAGTLDLAPSAMPTNARIAVASGAQLKLSNAATNAVKNLYLDGVKLAAGRWGAPGSVAAGTADFESPVFSGPGVLQVTDTTLANRERWKRMKYGQFTHYIYFGVNPDGSYFENIEYAANNFNAPKFADDLASMGVEYVVFTAWHANFVPMFNSAAVVRALGFQRNSSRDVVGDMITAVRAKGIRVILYAHPYQPVIYNYDGHNNMLNDCYAEMMDRYGDQIDGFWVDENDPGGNMDSGVDYPRLERTVRRRNPDIVLIQNFYGNIYACDVGTSEWGPPASANFSPDIGVANTQSQARPMAPGWNTTQSTNTYAARYSAAGIFRATVVSAGSCTDGGGINWAAGPYPGGGWEQGVLETMQAAGALIAPVAESIKNTYPSTSWITPAGTWISNVPYGIVGTRSTDDTKEYIHVLNPPGSSTLTLPAPADGKVFANARLLVNSNAVSLTQNGRAVQLTLTGTNTWNTNDTVIALDVVSAGDPFLANDTTADATYTGSWVYLRNRSTPEFLRDVHETTVNGDSVEFSFNGTDIELLGTSGSNRGPVDIYLDGLFQQTVSAQTAGTEYRRVLYQQTGLARGNHTLKAVKTGGTYLTIDAFRATELVDSAQPDIACQALTFFNNDATASNGVGYIQYDANWSYQQRDGNEYNRDAHWAQWNGSTFWIHFNGTGVQFVGLQGGIIDFYLDDVFVRQLNLNEPGTYSRNAGLDIKGLPAGWHTLKGVKVGDTYVHVDAFFVYNSQNSSWSSQADGTAIGGSWQRSFAYSDVATLDFSGTGLEVIAPHSNAGGTVAVNIQGAAYQKVVFQFVSQYAGEKRPQSVSFGNQPIVNLAPGNYVFSMSHNRSFGSIALDGFRIYMNWPGSGAPFVWGAGGGGGSGTWDVNTTANWNDGSQATKWYDFGGLDYAAIFQGTAGTVSLAANLNVNRLTFNTSGYTLQHNTLNFTGGNPTLTLGSNAAVTVASAISGSAGLTVSGPGTLTVTGTNTASGGITLGNGTLVAARSMQDNGIHTLGTGSLTINSNGTLRTTQNWATGSEWNPAAAVSVGAITINAGGTWSIEAVGMAVRNGLYLNGGSIIGSTAHADWGALYLRNTSVTAGGNAVSSIGVDTALNSITPITVSGGSQLNYGGNIHNSYGSTGGLTKSGNGVLLLNGTNIYTGATTISEGTLGGTGSIKGPVTIQSGAILAPGASLGTLTISNTLTLAAGSQTVMELNAATATNDVVRVTGAANYGGTLMLTNLAGTVSAGQTFKLFSAASRTGNFSAITPTNAGPGLLWSFNPTNGVLTALATVALNPTNVTASVAGTNLTLTWPADYTGWTLLSQTNNLQWGLSANTNDWLRLPGSSTTNRVVIPILPNTPGGYFRLVYP